MSQPPETSPRFSPDDALPPVEPPSAGFIVQLFVVPAVIVSIIVVVWLLFSWLALMSEEDSKGYIQALKRDNPSRWQTAVNLANALRQPNHKLKRDDAFARDLAALLDAEVASSAEHGEIEEVQLRIFLGRALGEIDHPVARAALLNAADAKTGDADPAVRETAVQALAVHAAPASGSEGAASDAMAEAELTQALLGFSRDGEPAVRSAAAYALGVVADEGSLARLREMLADESPNARYNAATGLARHGDVAAVPYLAAMLDPDEVIVVAAPEVKQREREYQRLAIIQSALQATDQLGQTAPQADLTLLEERVDALVAMDLDRIGVLAREVARRLHERKPQSAATP